MPTSPRIWVPMREVPGLDSLVEEAANALARETDLDNSPWLGLVLATCQHYLDRSQPEAAEAVADYMGERLRRLQYPSAVTRELLSYIAGIYSKVLEIAPPERERPLHVKLCYTAALQFHTAAFRNAQQDEESLKKGDQYADAAVVEYWAEVLNQRSEHASYEEQVSWMVSNFAAMERFAKLAAAHDFLFGHLVYRWLTKHVLSDWGFLTRVHEAEQRAAGIHRRHARCLRRVAAFWESMQQPLGQLTALETASYLHILELGDIDDGRRRIREALRVGDVLLFDQQLVGGPSSAVVSLRERLYRLARLSGDRQEMEDRLDLHCAHLRRDADRHYLNGEWNDAAQIYSNLGYRYFSAAEYSGSELIYQISIYFFEKAEYCRSKHTDEYDLPHGLDPREYRRKEADGFIYGASAKLGRGATARDFFHEAAINLSEAAEHVFQQFGLHDFYLSTAHYFLAQAHLLQASTAESLATAYGHISISIEALGHCFRMYRNVYSAYQGLLRHAFGLDRMPASDSAQDEALKLGGAEPEQFRSPLAKYGYPDPGRLLALAREIRCRCQAEDFRRFPEDVNDLRRALIYVNPIG